MRIKRLELLGFKSFKDRTVIQFDAGITGIVGPNGCGKSNIVDALVWVMGEQSSKHLRGTTMEDVIFNGSENFAPLGLAEVSLTLENDGGPFPAKWAKHSEIMVTRRLHRSGESEYFINKEPSRLKDIVDIFMDTGAGSKGFSIVEQGQIGKIITAKPEDRRTLIEEAAGITKFKVRKRESQRKLEGTEQNLVRLNDIIGELRRQLDSLQRQAKRAERYRELKTRAQELDLWLSSRKFVELKGEVNSVAQMLEEKKLAEQEGQTKFAIVMADLQNLKLELLELEKRVNEKQSEHFHIQTQVQKKESEIQLLQHEIESHKRSEEMASTLKAEVAARRDILRRDLDHASTLLHEAEKELETLNQESFEKTESAALHSLRARENDEKLTQVRRDLMGVVQGLTAVEVKISALKTQEEELKRRLTDAEAVTQELQSRRSEFDEHRKKAFNVLETQRQMQLQIMADVQNFEDNLGILKTDAAERRSQVDAFKDDFNETSSRLHGLERINNNFEGFKEGVRHVMTWQRERLQPLASGGFEVVADVVEVPKDYEVAMEAALGERLQSILATQSSNALTAIDLLKTKNAGRSSFLSQDILSQQRSSNSSALSGENGVRGFLKDLVRYPEQHGKAIAHVLEGVVVVDTLHNALRLRSGHQGFTFVTLEGDVIQADGTLTGGSSESADSGLLRQKREIKELIIRKEEAQGKLALAVTSLEKLEAQIETVAKDLERAQKSNFEQEILIHDRKKDLERAESELKNAEEALKRQGREEGLLRAQWAAVQQQIQLAYESLDKLTADRKSFEEACKTLESELGELKENLDSYHQAATQAQVKSAAKSQEVTGLREQLGRLEQGLAEAEGQITRHAEDGHKSSESLNAQILRLEEARRELEKQIADVHGAAQGLKQIRDRYEVSSGRVRELEQEAGFVQQTNSRLIQEIGEIQMKQSQSQMNEKYLVDQVMERYMLNLTEVAHEYASREGDGALIQAELEDLRDKLKKIGEVNLTAIQEYEDLSQRYEFLSKQQQDLVGAMDNLRKVIDRINRICNRRFRETFEAVNERFKKVFPILFGGGHAQLILLENPADGEVHGEPGVEIMAQPPGKKLQNVTLLSGGEKALTAVSLIFAIFLVKPSPFCLLDEVDAPLDDANVYRFNDLVKEMAKRSQVILVTHNKHTMAINNKLYGVTMEDPGVSKMVAVELNA